MSLASAMSSSKPTWKARFNSYPAVELHNLQEQQRKTRFKLPQLGSGVMFKGKQGEPFDPYGFDEAYAAPWYSKPFMLVKAGLAKVLNKVSGKPDPVEYYERSKQAPFRHSYQLAMHNNLARFVEGRLDLMLRNGQSGLILVLISLMLFLNWRVAFWAAVGLPVSFLGTFIMMGVDGQSR